MSSMAPAPRRPRAPPRFRRIVDLHAWLRAGSLRDSLRPLLHDENLEAHEDSRRAAASFNNLMERAGGRRGGCHAHARRGLVFALRGGDARALAGLERYGAPCQPHLASGCDRRGVAAARGALVSRQSTSIASRARFAIVATMLSATSGALTAPQLRDEGGFEVRPNRGGGIVEQRREDRLR